MILLADSEQQRDKIHRPHEIPRDRTPCNFTGIQNDLVTRIFALENAVDFEEEFSEGYFQSYVRFSRTVFPNALHIRELFCVKKS